MKIFKVVLTVIGAALLAGCTPKVITVEKVVFTPKIVKVPVTCELPEVVCSLGEGGLSTIKGLLECVKMQKEVIRACDRKQVSDIKKYRISND